MHLCSSEDFIKVYEKKYTASNISKHAEKEKNRIRNFNVKQSEKTYFLKGNVKSVAAENGKRSEKAVFTCFAYQLVNGMGKEPF